MIRKGLCNEVTLKWQIPCEICNTKVFIKSKGRKNGTKRIISDLAYLLQALSLGFYMY